MRPISTIAPELAQARLKQSLELVDFFFSLLTSNPALAKQAGRKVEEFMLPRGEVQRRHAHDLD